MKKYPIFHNLTSGKLKNNENPKENKFCGLKF